MTKTITINKTKIIELKLTAVDHGYDYTCTNTEGDTIAYGWVSGTKKEAQKTAIAHLKEIYNGS